MGKHAAWIPGDNPGVWGHCGRSGILIFSDGPGKWVFMSRSGSWVHRGQTGAGNHWGRLGI